MQTFPFILQQESDLDYSANAKRIDLDEKNPFYQIPQYQGINVVKIESTSLDLHLTDIELGSALDILEKGETFLFKISPTQVIQARCKSYSVTEVSTNLNQLKMSIRQVYGR